MSTRLTKKELKQYREKQLRKQKFVCPLCGTKITYEEATLDHDHGTGKVRKVLHRSCNQSEGRILSWCNRSRGSDPLLFVTNLSRYWRSNYDRNPYHPNHLTPKQKKAKMLRRKLKTLKSEKRISEVKQELADLKEDT